MENWGLCETRAAGVPRRQLLGGGLALALGAWLGRSALAQVTTAPRHEGNVLVTIFLRGGMDGLSMVVPYGDDDYHSQRPTLSLGTPKRNGIPDLDGFYGLHPTLKPLQALYADGKLAALHGVGSLDQSRSHFEAMATMERGAGAQPAEVPSGWLGRALEAIPAEHASPLRAVAFGGILPDILRGATNASLIHSLEELKLGGSPQFASALEKLYTAGDDPVSVSGVETMAVMKTLEKLDPKSYRPEGGAKYPESPLGDGLRQTAILLKADVGLTAAALDRGGWDTHVTQGGATGYLALQFTDVAQSLAAFAADLGSMLDRVTVVVMTEFGRRVPENSGLGTDHGRGSAWLMLGGGVKGGKVYADWKGLKPENLEGPGDLPVTTDYRDVLTEVLARRLADPARARAIFPSAPGKLPGVMA